MGFFGGAKPCDRTVSNAFVKAISDYASLLFVFLDFTGDPSSYQESSKTENFHEIFNTKETSNCYRFLP